jgi:hypothetical protein
MEERSATDLFAHYLDAKERGEDPDFDALCAAHPEHVSTLRAWRAEQERMEAVLAREKTILSAAGGAERALRPRRGVELGRHGRDPPRRRPAARAPAGREVDARRPQH